MNITFSNVEDKNKAFNVLIRERYTIVGIDLNTINISKTACELLKRKGIRYKEVLTNCAHCKEDFIPNFSQSICDGCWQEDMDDLQLQEDRT